MIRKYVAMLDRAETIITDMIEKGQRRDGRCLSCKDKWDHSNLCVANNWLIARRKMKE